MNRLPIRQSTIGFGLIVLIMIAVVLSTLSTNNKLADTQSQLQIQSMQREAQNQCTSTILFDTVRALNERTEFSVAQAQANVDLQNAQVVLVTSLLTPQQTGGVDGTTDALSDYLTALKEFQRIVGLNTGRAQEFPYPTQEEYLSCLSNSMKEK